MLLACVEAPSRHIQKIQYCMVWKVGVPPMAAGAIPSTFAPTHGYRQSVAWLLMGVYTLNFMDRQVMSVLLPQIQKEFAIGDAVAGLLHGTAFALFYVTLALP